MVVLKFLTATNHTQTRWQQCRNETADKKKITTIQILFSIAKA